MRSEEARANGTEADPVASSAYVEHATEYFCVEVVRTDVRNCAIDTFSGLSGAEKCNEVYRRTDGVRAPRERCVPRASHRIQAQNQRLTPSTSTVLFPPFPYAYTFPTFQILSFLCPHRPLECARRLHEGHRPTPANFEGRWHRVCT